IRATVQLYIDGKIREWYSREDGKGGVFLLNTWDVAEARSIMESLPLAKEHNAVTSVNAERTSQAVIPHCVEGRRALSMNANLHLIGGHMSPETLFRIHLVLGYVAWLLCFSAYIWPRLKAMDWIEAQRAIATLHSFRFFGLVFILPGVVGNLPKGFATFAAYGDFTTGLLAILALLTVRIRPVFWMFVVAFNLVGLADLIIDYYNATQLGLPALAGELGSTYVIPIIY